jgi:hypothetical protein
MREKEIGCPDFMSKKSQIWCQCVSLNEKSVVEVFLNFYIF